MSSQAPRIAIIDDDPFVIEHLLKDLGDKFPQAEVVGIRNPIAPAGFDVYIIDREFDHESFGHELVRRVKKVAPNSLVIAYSAFLDRNFLRSLVLENCEGAFDKGSLEELEKMTVFIGRYLEGGLTENTGAMSSLGTIRTIFDLVREWNTRLSRNGEATAKYHGNA